MSDIGDRLRQARESQGLSTTEVEQATRIRRAYIEALEEERFDELPGDVYVKGFLRNYAQFLGLDPNSFVQTYHSSESVSLGSPQVLDEPLFQRRTRRRLAGILITVVIVAILAALGWYAYNYFYLGNADPWPLNLWISSTTPTIPTKVASLPSPTKPSEPASTQTPQPTQTTIAEEPTATETAQPTDASPTQTRKPSATRTQTRTPSATPTQQLAIQVDAQILAECYVRVVVDGEQVLERILQQGENQSWIAQERIEIRLGDAAAAQITVNGTTVPPLGGSGEIVDLEYSLDNLPTP